MAGGAPRRYFLNARLGRYATIRNVNGIMGEPQYQYGWAMIREFRINQGGRIRVYDKSYTIP